jgi:outer membrane protein TolC
MLWTTASAQSQAPAATDTLALTARAAVDYAVANQAAVKTARLDQLIQLAKNKEVSGLALPTVTADGSYQYSPILQKSAFDLHNFSDSIPAGTYQYVAFQLKHNVTGEFKLTQVLFDPSVLVALQARKSLEELVSRNVVRAEIDVKVNVYKAYYNVLNARKALKILNENIDMFSKNLHDVTVTYQNGLAEKLDVDRLTVQLTNLQTEATKLQNLTEIGLAALKFQMGMPLRQPLILSDTLSVENVTADLVTDTFSYASRIEYQLAQTQKEVNEFDLKRYKLKALPSLSLFGTGGTLRGSNKFDYFQNNMWYGYVTVGASLNVTIFSGLQRKRQVEQAELNVRKSDVSLENTKLAIDLEREQSSTSFRNNVLTLQAQEKNMQLAQNVYNTTQIKYREGVGSSLEVTTAENDLLTSQNNYFTALYNAVVAKIDYLRANGKL